MTLDGTDTKAFGLIPVEVTGGYDMPNRRTPYFYDWGDTIEPLLTATFAAWETRVVRVDFLYDQRVQTSGAPSATYVDTLVQGYKTGADIALVLSDAVGSIGSMTVRLKAVTNQRKYRTSNHRMIWEFVETVPQFNGSVPGAKNGGSISLDGYGMDQFSARVVSVRDISGLGVLQASPATTYLSSTPLSDYRGLHGFTIKLVINDSDPISRLASLQKVLTGGQVLPFVYGGLSFDTFCGRGFAVRFLNDETLMFDLTLFRL